MKFKVEKDIIAIEDQENINTGAINYYEIEFEFDENWDGLTKIAIILKENEVEAIEVPILLNKISVPFIEESNLYNIGIIGYTIEGEIKTKQISTNLVSFWVGQGTGSINTKEQDVPEPNIWEQYVATMQGILENTVEIKETIEGICTEIQEYKDTTKGYMDDTEALKNDVEEIVSDFEELAEGKTTDFNNNATTKTEAFDLNAGNKITTFNNNATEKTNIINGIKDEVEDLKDETLGYKNETKTSADNAKVSEDNAKDSETDAEQALIDLLAMLGSSVATLTGGKLTPSQIPDLSINDVFPVADTDEMLELTAQRGDVAIIVVNNIVTDSYILSTDDATVLSNWKKLGVSYVANAGHATTADNATDSEKINGKRIVKMTETQYASAVIDEDTYYMVVPD